MVRAEIGIQTYTRQNILPVSAKRASHRGRNTFIGLILYRAAGVIVPAASPELGFAYVGSHSQLRNGDLLSWLREKHFLLL